MNIFFLAEIAHSLNFQYSGQIFALFILCKEAKKISNSLQKHAKANKESKENFTNRNHIIILYFIVVNKSCNTYSIKFVIFKERFFIDTHFMNENIWKMFFFHIHCIIREWIQLENQWTSFTSEKKVILNDQMALRMAEGHE